MAKKNKTTVAREKKESPLSKKARIRWIVGFVLLLVVIVGAAFLVDYLSHRDVAATVNGEVIRKSEIDTQMQMAEKLNTQRKVYFDELLKYGLLTPEEYKAQVDSLDSLKNRKGTLDSMVDFKIVELAAIEQHINVSQDEVIAKERAAIDAIRKNAEKGENENIVNTWKALETSVNAIDMDMEEYVDKVLGPSKYRSQIYSDLKDHFVDPLSDKVKSDPVLMNQMFDAYLLYLRDQVKVKYYEK
ncbi:MAG: SurA N-terminal domain-containing protein [Clostridia bacterium]|nr:SurA N-terminal domain-containing protein [Clostridia bacterium]